MKSLFTSTALFVLALAFALPAFAQDTETVVVTPSNLHGWFSDDTRPGGTVGIVATPDSMGGNGALQMTTDNTNAAKAQYMHSAGNVLLSSVTDLSYATKQNSASFAGGDASYQLAVNLCGTTGFTTLVYEPYENGTVLTGQWQTWDVDQGQFWSSKNVTCGDYSVTAGAGGPPYYTLNMLKAMFPNATVQKFGVNIGSYNPNYNVLADYVQFNSTIYNFERYSSPSNMDECKKGGWATFDPVGGPFKNQGQCVSSTVGANAN